MLRPSDASDLPVLAVAALVALVGNNGSSFEPHLHFEVTTSPLTTAGEGLPYLLDEYEAVIDGITEQRRRELPTKGTIANFRQRNLKQKR